MPSSSPACYCKTKKLPVILSREELWQMLQSATLLKHKILIGLLYGCGLRCIEVRNLRLQNLDFDRKLVHIVQSKGNKDRYVPLSEHLVRGIKKYIATEHPTDWLFNGQPNGRGDSDVDSRYSQRGVQWVIKTVSKQAGILKEVHTHMLRHSYATHLLEDGLNIITVQKLLGHANIENTMRALQQCRTAALGGHVDVCTDCAAIHISYNSCRNRHCPKCQGHKKQEWIRRREAELLPCTYFHVVFTLPQQLNSLALYNPTVAYNALFTAAWQTLHQFGIKAGIQMGMIAVLHTWGQNLSLHPHLHCIVPGAGINTKRQWQLLPHSSKYLFAVKALSKVFRAKYIHYLRSHNIKDQPLYNSLYNQQWVVYAKRPFGTAMQVVEYLGRYTHKVAISNHRIQQVTADEVSFSYKDYRTNGKAKTMTLSNNEFARRFSQHILPHCYVRIRHYGILNSSWKRGKLQALQLQMKITPVVVKTMLHQCRCCKTGTLITIEVFGKRGPPKHYLLENQTVPVK